MARQNRFAEALQQIQTAKDLHPSDRKRGRISALFLHARKREAALQELTAALETDPALLTARNNKAMLLAELGKTTQPSQKSALL